MKEVTLTQAVPQRHNCAACNDAASTTYKFMPSAYLKAVSLLRHPLLTIALILLVTPSLCHAENTNKPILVSTYTAAISEYTSFVNGRDPLKITDYSMGRDITRRVILEMILMQQALHRGGITETLRYQSSSDDYKNTLSALVSGKTLIHTDSYWRKDLLANSATLYISDATIEHSQYIVGLYTSPDNTHALKSDINNIRNLSAVSNKAWSADWQALEKLPLKRLEHARHWRLMAKMVEHQDIDFLLVPFQGTDDHSIGQGKSRLIPIPNLKLALHDSRHFAVSKSHIDGERVLNALNAGIRILKSEGIWRQAYIDSGVFDPRVDDWLIINPEP